MEAAMRVSRLLLVVAAAAATVLPGTAQDASNLPSAPSATLEQQQQRQVPPPQAASQSPQQEKKPDAPVLESLDPPRKIVQQQAPVSASASSSGGMQTQTQGTTTAQQPATNPGTDPASGQLENNPQATIRTQVNEVNVVFTVTDKHNHFVKDLKKDDFKVLDDKKPPQSIRGFSAETNLPLRVGLLVDASNSIRDRFRFEQQASIEFLNQIIRPNRDQAFVLGFDTTPEVTQDFTGDAEKLSNGVRMLRPGGGTALYDALYGACRDKLLKTQPGTRRAIILLSDGEDNQSRVTRDDAIEEAQRAEVIVYAISTNVSGVKSRGDKIMEAIAAATGGRVFFPFKIEEVSDAFSQIQEELRSQYAISYRPADFTADGKYRTIDIEALNKKYKVRSRRGYFAPRSDSESVGGR
jgi:Ca-activated chloride channel homolog